MRHHAEHVAALVDDAGDAVRGAVGVGRGGHSAPLVAVPEHHLAALLQAAQGGRVGEVVALAVGDRHADHLVLVQVVREGEVCALADQLAPGAAKFQAGVAEQGAGQQAGLTEDLEAVADSPAQSATLGELDAALHHRREAGDRPGPQIIAIAEAAREDHAVDPPQVAVLVPQVLQLRPRERLDDQSTVPIRPRPRKHHNPKLQGTTLFSLDEPDGPSLVRAGFAGPSESLLETPASLCGEGGSWGEPWFSP